MSKKFFKSGCFDAAQFGRFLSFVFTLTVLIGVFSILASAAPTGSSLITLQNGDNKLNWTGVGVPLTRVTVWLKEEVTRDNRITVEILEEKPGGAEEPPLPVNTYLRIEVGEISELVENATIEFKVLKSWVEQNRIDKIVLLRLGDGWEELPTRLVDSSDLYLHYEAISPGLSVFAIAGKPIELPAYRISFVILLTAGVVGGIAATYWFLTRPLRTFISTRKLRRAVSKRAPKLKLAGEVRAGKLKLPSPKVKRKTIKDIERLKRLKRKMEEKE